VLLRVLVPLGSCFLWRKRRDGLVFDFDGIVAGLERQRQRKERRNGKDLNRDAKIYRKHQIFVFASYGSFDAE
jgi:Ethanolamine utilization protein EutJ (predicted chaperonin)